MKSKKNNKNKLKMKKLITIMILWLYCPYVSADYSRFYWGQCTRYVAQYKNVNWWWNAKHWYKNAKSMWYDTGTKPKEGAIIVYDIWEYGHVAIVKKIIDKNNFIISEMNRIGKNRISERLEKVKNKTIIWYIY
jgi:surface antigen